MKTLVIHPKDYTTKFLSVIYQDTDWTIVDTSISNRALKKAIKEHDRIVMLGHGSELGLFGYNRLVINSKHVYLLRQKECICIWCNANEFVNKYDLKGFHTGMIISEYEEALMFCIIASDSQIEASNKLFASSARQALTQGDEIAVMKELYDTNDHNPIILFNRDNIFKS